MTQEASRLIEGTISSYVWDRLEHYNSADLTSTEMIDQTTKDVVVKYSDELKATEAQIKKVVSSIYLDA